MELLRLDVVSRLWKVFCRVWTIIVVQKQDGVNKMKQLRLSTIKG